MHLCTGGMSDENVEGKEDGVVHDRERPEAAIRVTVYSGDETEDEYEGNGIILYTHSFYMYTHLQVV